MKLPQIIQGGMGAAISTSILAKAVAMQGHLGVISGTGLGAIMPARLMDGDLEGHMRRALSRFPLQEHAQRVLDKYYIPGGKDPKQPYKPMVMWTDNPPQSLNETTVVSNFVEVFLAKEGHDNPIGINRLEKLQMPCMASLYGAMLAGVDVVIMGAGIPIQIPGILDKLANHEAVSYRLDVIDADKDDDIRIHFDPEEVFPGIAEKVGPLKRPIFLPIISSFVLARALLKRSSGEVNGFVVETPVAGGHNAPPRGIMKLDEMGQPIYGPKDYIDVKKIKKLGLPFWLAGGYGNPEKFQEALAAGAEGVQVGTLFAFSDESEMDEKSKRKLIQDALNGEASVRTDPIASPTGFPFKFAYLEGSVSEQSVYEARERICNAGFLRHIYKKENGTLGYRCSAEPVEQHIKKGGTREDTVNRTCLCNNLFAAAGFAQHRKTKSGDIYTEPPLVTSGDAFVDIYKIFKPGQTSYKVKDVIDYLTGGTPAE